MMNYMLSLLLVTANLSFVSSSSTTVKSKATTTASFTTTTARATLMNIQREVRRKFLNFGSTFGTASQTSVSPYERIKGQPVFCVTTPWGSPYMNMEKLDNGFNEVIPAETTTPLSSTQSISDEQNEYRMVALYFLDPDDALSTYYEMKQMENMGDIRITTCSLGKALRQASNLGLGLVTGQPPNPLDGKYKPPDDGSIIRYKIMPSKRQVYYSARCHGKERVGLFHTNPVEDAQCAILGNMAIEAANLLRRREKMERKIPINMDKLTPLQAQNQHMYGYTGIPIFYCHGLYKKLPFFKRIITGTKYEIPMFMNYEDLVTTYQKVNHYSSDEQPNNVEVFNLWDVLTSMDQYQYQQKQKKKIQNQRLLAQLSSTFQKTIKTKRTSANIKTAPTSKKQNNNESSKIKSSNDEPGVDLNSIIFIPNSYCVQYKDYIGTRGNGKARLRPMRNYSN